MANNRNIAPLGIAVRIGLHASEVVFGNEEGQGIAVNTAARVSALAGASEILVSRIVKDLAAGSGTQLSHQAQHDLNRLSEPMDVYSVVG